VQGHFSTITSPTTSLRTPEYYRCDMPTNFAPEYYNLMHITPEYQRPKKLTFPKKNMKSSAWKGK